MVARSLRPCHRPTRQLAAARNRPGDHGTKPDAGWGFLHPIPPSRTAGSVQTGNETCLDGVAANGEHNGNGRCRILGRQGRRFTASGGDNAHGVTHKLCGERWQLFVLTMCPAILDRNILALNIARLGDTSVECRYKVRCLFGRPGVEEPDHRHRRLLRARRERPSGRSAKQSDELAPL
jgi:hypothetical protein